MTAREQARLLGLFLWIFAGFNIVLVGVIAVVYVVVFGVLLSQMPRRPHEPSPEFMIPFLIVVFAVAFVVVVLVSIPKIVAGYGLRNEKPWARIWAIIASIMAAMSFPIGTAVGVFGLVFLFGDEGKRYFENPEYGHIPTVEDPVISAPEPNSWQ
jgi:hypothetical protein